MKKIIVIVAALFLLLDGKSQNSGFTDEGNRWSFYYKRVFDMPCNGFLIARGDTVISGKPYRKIYDAVNTVICGVREDTSQKVFVRVFNNNIRCALVGPFWGVDTSKDVLLYNFKAQVGDTLYAQKIGSLSDTITIKTFVRSIETGFYFGKNRKRFRVARYHGGSEPSELDYIYEGVGSQIMPFNPLSYPVFATEGSASLTCFNKLTDNSQTCLSPTKDVENTPDIVLLNNPVTAVIDIAIGEAYSTQLNYITLSDISGKELKRVRHNGSTKIQIDAAQLPNGVYIVGFVSKEGSFSKKMVVAR